MAKAIIVAPLSALSKRTRLYKLSNFLYGKGFKKIMHVSWERKLGEAAENQLDFNVKKEILIKGGGYGGSKVKVLYFIWMTKVFFKGFSFKKDNIVWALGFESAFPLLLSSKIKGYQLVFDDADRFSMLFPFPQIVKVIIKKLEEFTSKNVNAHVIPSLERYDFFSDKFFLIKNVPSEKEVILAKEIYERSEHVKTDTDITININGWLGNGRGITNALKLANLLKMSKVKFILAGKLDCPDAKALSELESVTYIGNVSNSEALSTYFMSDLVFTYYDPSQEINTFAESNKWGDAVRLGNGVIVNSEVVTAKPLIDAGAAISIPYHDVDLLSETIIKLISNNDELTRIKENAKKVPEYQDFFEDRISELLSVILK